MKKIIFDDKQKGCQRIWYVLFTVQQLHWICIPNWKNEQLPGAECEQLMGTTCATICWNQSTKDFQIVQIRWLLETIIRGLVLLTFPIMRNSDFGHKSRAFSKVWRALTFIKGNNWGGKREGGRCITVGTDWGPPLEEWNFASKPHWQ
jgi:hypothetical protein